MTLSRSQRHKSRTIGPFSRIREFRAAPASPDSGRGRSPPGFVTPGTAVWSDADTRLRAKGRSRTPPAAPIHAAGCGDAPLRHAGIVMRGRSTTGAEPGIPGSCGAPYGPGTLRTGGSGCGGTPLHNRLSGTYRGAEPGGTRDTGCRAPRASAAHTPKTTGLRPERLAYDRTDQSTPGTTVPAATNAPDPGPRPPSDTTHHLPPARGK